MRTYTEQLEQRALDALVEMMLDGKKYPPKREGYRMCIDLRNILNDIDSGELVSIVCELNGTKDIDEFNKFLREIVENYLRDGQWHVQLTETMREDDEAAARESAEESKRERMGL